MKTKLTTVVLSLILAVVGHAGTPVSIADLPKPVRNTVVSYFPDSTLLSAVKDIDHGQAKYEVTIRYKNIELEIAMSPEGKILDVGMEASRYSQMSSSPDKKQQLSGLSMVNESELRHLRRCVDLATEALEAGDEPFGSVLVSADGTVLLEDRNHVASGDQTRHPEFRIARWAAENMTPEERATATVYTSGEHCPMCAAAHAWVGLGRIVYVSSSEQLSAWLDELGVPPPPVRTLPIGEVAPGLLVEGPIPGLDEEVRELHRRFHSAKQ